ncbi:hypothetical protein [Epilithonimonas xixisoli]|uniref:Uncharacterized protein n=1 Tax=Epilithonimonas xixisoli TaxID=1476462 RepID=A0A4R8IJG4_9FLAO|nr:hypothetical protein [Epilithonimonas xixisoli]TDX86759.1 hypothetical protein B0I22_0909 [Epilithonimonas xixisoli]
MGIPLLIALLFLIFFLVLIPIVFVILYKTGNKKTAYIISSILLLIFLSLAFMNSVDAFVFSKNDVKKDLKFLNITLNDDFKIVDNKIEGFPEYFQFTKLKISEADRNRIISQITISDNFKIYDSTALSEAKHQLRKIPNKTSINFQKNNIFYREYYEKEQGYVPIEISISLTKNSDTLELQRIED